MNRLEQKVRPVLTPLIRGEQIILIPEMRQTLAEWAAMKFIVMEHHDPSDFVTPERDRVALKEKMEIPTFFKIWMFRCGTGGWEAGYSRSSFTVSLSDKFSFGFHGKNTQSITWGLGDLLFHHTATTVPMLHFDLPESVKTYGVQLWPPMNGNISWPVARRFNFDEARRLSDSVNSRMRSPNVGWMPFPA
jgi:hypothetical protein